MTPRWKQRPPGWNWGEFGADDQRGRMNWVDRAKVLQGVGSGTGRSGNRINGDPSMRNFLAAAAVTLALAGCYPGEISSTQELDVFITFPRNEANFANYLTFAIPDTIVQIDEDSSDVQISHENDEEVVDQVRDNLVSLGFTEVDFPSGDPDVVVARLRGGG